MKYLLVFLFSIIIAYGESEYLLDNFILHETFDTEESSFFTGKEGKARAYIQDGVYILDNKERYLTFETYSNMILEENKAYIASINLKYLEGQKKSRYGIYIEVDGGNIEFTLNKIGELKSKIHHDSGYIDQETADISHILTANDYNNLTIVFGKGIINIFINDELATEYNISNEEKEISFGFILEPLIKIEVDNVMFEELNF